jgi:AraC-like DNA-binding protein
VTNVVDSDLGLRPMRAPDNAIMAGAHCSAGWDVATPWHHHDMHQLLYAFDGSVEVEGRQGRYRIPRQFAVWIPAGAVHRTTIQRVGSGSVFLDPLVMAASCDEPRVIPAPGLLREMVMYAMRWPLERIEDAVSDAFFLCFARLCESWIADDVKLVLPSSGDLRLAAILEHTRTHCATISFREIADRHGMSERTLRRRFTNGLGLSWEEYRLRVRMSTAIEALDGTADSIGEISAAVGYQNPSAFARAFRSLVGMGPSEYRKLAPAALGRTAKMRLEPAAGLEMSLR